MIIFVSVQSKGVFHMSFPEGEERWNVQNHFLRRLAALHVKHPTYAFIAPSIQNYAILHEMPAEVGVEYEDWKARCRTLIGACDEVWVMAYRKWSVSKGVTDETEFARSIGKPVRLICEHPPAAINTKNRHFCTICGEIWPYKVS